jgi:hypothetical protein
MMSSSFTTKYCHFAVITTVTVIVIILLSTVLNNGLNAQKREGISQTEETTTNNTKHLVSEIITGNDTLFTKELESPLSLIDNLTEGGNQKPSAKGSTTAPAAASANSPPLPGVHINNNTLYNLPRNGSKISTPENNSNTDAFGNGKDIALVEPTFTAAAYNGGFYKFFNLYAHTPPKVNVTSNLALLTARVNQITVNSSFAMLKLLSSLKWVNRDSNITVLTDANVDNGSIFTKNGSNAYNTIILGHQEYITQREYDNLKHFVANGGTMIILDGNVFFAEVKYDNNAHTITLVKGHWWEFDGKSAWKSVGERWRKETSRWVGSNYLCYQCISVFGNNPFGYNAHEEQYLTNPKDIILLNYNAKVAFHKPASSSPVRYVIATYVLYYQKGKVIALGIYSEDILRSHKFSRYLDSLLLRYAPQV